MSEQHDPTLEEVEVSAAAGRIAGETRPARVVCATTLVHRRSA